MYMSKVFVSFFFFGGGKQARTQELNQGGKFFAPLPERLLPPLALKMLLFYIKSTTCPLGGPFSIQGLYITMYPSV